MGDRITVEGQDGAFNAYIARPKILPSATVVVLQELFGVNADIRKTCDEFAEQALQRSRPIYSGVRSLALILASHRMMTGSTVCASIKRTIATPASEIFETP